MEYKNILKFLIIIIMIIFSIFIYHIIIYDNNKTDYIIDTITKYENDINHQINNIKNNINNIIIDNKLNNTINKLNNTIININNTINNINNTINNQNDIINKKYAFLNDTFQKFYDDINKNISKIIDEMFIIKIKKIDENIKNYYKDCEITNQLLYNTTIENINNKFKEIENNYNNNIKKGE